MKKLIRQFKSGNIILDQQKRCLGYSCDNMVIIYEDGHIVFEEKDMTTKEANSLYFRKLNYYKNKKLKTKYTGTVNIPVNVIQDVLSIRDPSLEVNIYPVGSFRTTYTKLQRNKLKLLGATFKDEMEIDSK